MVSVINITNKVHADLMNSFENIQPSNMELFVFFGDKIISRMDDIFIAYHIIILKFILLKTQQLNFLTRCDIKFENQLVFERTFLIISLLFIESILLFNRKHYYLCYESIY